MEKQLNLQINKQMLLRNDGSPPPKQKQKAKISMLGGIHLYNEDYKRHLCQNAKKSNTNAAQNTKNDEQQLGIQHEITDFLQHRQQYKFNINSAFTSQIQNIIHTFKTSHHTTNRFLQEHQNQNQYHDNFAVFSFQELFQYEQNKNKVKYTRLMEKLFQQFRQIVMKEIQKMKLEEINKVKDKENLNKNYATQTSNEHEFDIILLRKELERKEAEYNALYEYKRNMINEGQNMVKSIQIKCQFQKSLISKLENQVASKNLQLRNLQTTLKQTQDRLFSRIVELQKLYANSQARQRQSISSIKQMINPFELLQRNPVLSNFLTKINSKKKRFKQRAESVLSVTQSLFSTLKDKDDIVASMADIAAKSLRDIDVHFDQELLDEHYVQQLKRMSKNSKNSVDAQNLFKILEVYHNNMKHNSIDKANMNANKKIKNKVGALKKHPQRNSSQLAQKIIEKIDSRGSIRQQATIKPRAFSKEKQKKDQFKFSTRKISRPLQVPKDQSKSKLASSRKQSFQKSIISNRKEETPSASPVREQKPSIFKVSMKEIPTSIKQEQIKSNSQINTNKKLKKGVSFQIESYANLHLQSLQVNICIHNSSKKSTCETIYTSSIINQKPIENTLENFDKHRFTKNKLLKTKLKQQIHKKVSSQLGSQTLSTLGWNSTNTNNNERPTISHNASINNFYRPSPFLNQKDRFSCHTSQDKFIPVDNNERRPKPRNSYSRLQRSTIAPPVISEDYKQMRIIKQMVTKYKDKSDYHEKVANFHQGCGQNCQHIKRYLQYYDKCRQHNRKENIKLKVQNLNNNIRFPLSNLGKLEK